MRYVLQSVVSDRGNQMPWKGLSIKHQTFDRYQRLISIFLTNPKDIVVTIVFLEATLLFSQKDIKKLDICANMLLSNTFKNIGRILTGP